MIVDVCLCEPQFSDVFFLTQSRIIGLTYIDSLHAGYFFILLLLSTDIFFKINLFKNSFSDKLFGPSSGPTFCRF